MIPRTVVFALWLGLIGICIGATGLHAAETVAAGSQNDSVYVYDYGGALLWGYDTGADVVSVAVSADGEYIAVGSRENKLYLFDRGGTKLWENPVPVSYGGLGNGRESKSVAISDEYVVAGCTDGLYVYNYDGSLNWSHSSSQTCVSISPNGHYIAASDVIRGTVDFFTSSSSTPVWSDTVNAFWVATSNLGYVAVGADGVYLYDQSGTQIWQYSYWQLYGIIRVDMSRDGMSVVAANDDPSDSRGCVLCYFNEMKDGSSGWSSSDGDAVWTFSPPFNPNNDFYTVAISGDGEYIAVGMGPYLFHRSSSVPIQHYTAPTNQAIDLTFDGQYCPCGSYTGSGGTLTYWSKDQSTALWTKAMSGIVQTVAAPGAPAGPAWLTTPNWRMLLTSYGYSDVLLARKPHWRRAWPWHYSWFWDEMLSGEWAAAVYYDEITSPAIAQGPNTGAPQSMWLEPDFIYPDWTTNSGFYVVSPIRTWNRGELPLPYLDTGTSKISNGDVEITIDYMVWDDQTAMGRCAGVWPWSWISFVWSDRYILQQTYAISNVSGGTLSNLELSQFLHGHPGTHDEVGWWGNWEVYDPNQKSLIFDNWDTYHYDITQWGRQYMWLWPWPYLYGRWWGYNYIGLHSETAPSTGRSLSPYGLGDYVGHAPGKPARPGVHWDVEEDNLNPQGLPCTLYPGWPPWPIFGSEVAGAETWYLDDQLSPGESVEHDVLLTIANRPYHGWHWGWDRWYWYDDDWPYWGFPSFWRTDHPMGPPYYKLWIDYPFWWYCWLWPRPPYPIWFGVALPNEQVEEDSLTVDGVFFKEYAPEGGGTTLATFAFDQAVTDSLEENYAWDDCQWFGYSLSNYVLPDSNMVVYVELSGEETGGASPSCYMHVMMGDSVFGWSPDRYDSLPFCDSLGSYVEPVETFTPGLAQNSPNPFTTATEIRYALSAGAHVELAVYDVAGRKVRALVNEYQAYGPKSVVWDGTNDAGSEVSGGIYFYYLRAGNLVEIRKMVLLK